MNGYLRAQRGRFKHPLFKATKQSPWCRGYAWDWMVAQAAWKDHKASVKGKTVAVQRGQFITSIRFMAEAFGWSKSSVDRFITRLKADAMIGTEAGTGQIRITICNYDTYQATETTTGTAAGTGSGTGAGQERDKVERREKKGKEKDSLSSFDEWWKLVPRKVGKGAARKAFAKAIKQTDIETLSAAMRHHAKSVAGKEERFIPHPSRWLNEERWEDEDTKAGNVVSFGAFGTGEVVR